MFEEKFLLENSLLYKTESMTIKTDHTITVTGKPNLKRALEKHRDFWKLAVNQKDYKKKKIIISDWLVAYTAHPNYIQERLIFWTALLAADFEIYVWTNQGLQTVTTPKKLYETLHNVDPIHCHDLKEELRKKNIGKEESYICDFTQTEILLSKYFNKINNFNLNLLSLRLLNETETDKIINSVNQSPTLTLHILLGLGNYYLKFSSIKRLAKTHKKIVLSVPNNSEGVAEFIKEIPEIKELTLHKYPETSPDFLRPLTEISSLTFSSSQSPVEYLFEALQFHTALTDLTLTINVESNSFSPFICPPALQKLKLYKGTLTHAQLNSLTNLPLSTLGLYANTLIGELQAIKFPSSLKELTLVELNIDLSTAVSMIKNCSGIETLYLRGFSERNWCEDILFPSTLIRLALAKISLNVKQLNQILKNCNSLQDLTFLSLNLSNSGGESIDFPLSLKNISITAGDFYLSQFQLIEHCNSLETLKINNFPDYYVGEDHSATFLEEDIFNFRLPASLHVLELSMKILDFDHFERAFENCTQLKELIINNIKIDKCFFIPSLQKLNLEKTEVDFFTLGDVLEQCTNLQELNLSHKLLGSVNFPCLSSTMKKLNLTHTDIKIDSLHQLVTTTPNLEELILEKCFLLSTEYLSLPKSLTVISLVETYINYNFALNLLNEHPALRKIKMDSHFFSENERYILENDFPRINFEFIGEKVSPSTQQDINTSEFTIDANTGNSSVPLVAKQIFHYKLRTKPEINLSYTWPAPNHYRISAFTTVKINNQKIILANMPIAEREEIPSPHEENIRLSNQANAVSLDDRYKEHYMTTADVFLGEFTERSDEAGYVILPTLSAYDELIGLQTHPHQEYAYTGKWKDNHLMFVKFKTPLTKPIHFKYLIKSDFYLSLTNPAHENRVVLHIPHDYQMSFTPEQLSEGLKFDDKAQLKPSPIVENFFQLPLKEQYFTLIQFFRNFQPQASHSLTSDLSMQLKDFEIFNDIIANRKGVCRHYARSFKLLAAHFLLSMRGIGNPLHEFGEINLNGQWYCVDFGGGRAERTLIQPMTQIKKSITSSRLLSSTALQVAPLTPNNRFQTWNTIKIGGQNLEEYAKKLLEFNASKILVRLHPTQVEPLYICLLNIQKNYGLECLYIHHLKELNAQEVKIEKDGTFSDINSAVIQFLNTAAPGDVFILNISNSFASQIKQRNRMLNNIDASLFSINIPAHLKIIVMLDHNEPLDPDLASRLPHRTECPESLNASALKIAEATADELNTLQIIDFYDEDWRTVLEGEININEEKVYEFIFSDFANAALKGHGVILQHAPWENPAFRAYLNQLLIHRRLRINGEIFSIPSTFIIRNSNEPYQFITQYIRVIHTSELDVDQMIYALNPTMLYTFSDHLRCNRAKQFELVSGILKQFAGQTLQVYVTHSLSNAQWAKWLKTVEELKVHIFLCVAPNISVPFFPVYGSEISRSYAPLHLSPKQHLAAAEDIEFATCNFKNVITINADHTNLFENIAFNDNHALDYYPSVLAKKLREKILFVSDEETQSIILKGHLSASQAQQLSSLLLPKPYIWLNGKLRLIQKNKILLFTDKAAMAILPFAFYQCNKPLSMTKWETIFRLTQITEQQYLCLSHACGDFYTSTQMEFSYIQYLAMVQYLQQRPAANPLKTLLRLKPNYQAELKLLATTAWKNAKSSFNLGVGINKNKNNFNDHRMDKVKTIFKFSPYVFLVGPSGTGKTTFVNIELKKAGYEILKSMDLLKAWLHKGKAQPAILFIDEANLLAEGTFDSFESLFDNPPGIYLDGIFYPINENHKIVFAGNYGHFKSRKQHVFFERHGAVVTFGEFPQAYLRHEVIAPKLKRLLANDNEQWAFYENSLLNFYYFINSKFAETHPFTIRNLDMMILSLSISRQSNLTPQNSLALALYDEALSAGCACTDDDERITNCELIKKWLEENVGVNIAQLKKHIKKQLEETMPSHKLGRFYITKRRINLLRIFDQALAIRAQRNALETAVDGIRAIVLEGDTGIGKTLLVEEYLKSKGFNKAEINLDKSPANPAIAYYYLDDAAEFEVMVAILNRAAKEGSIVIIDEMNTQDFKSLLNPILSGERVHPLFMLFAAQNPISYGYRQPFSQDFRNRINLINLKNYTRNDLLKITDLLKISDKEGSQLVDEYLTALQYAKAHQKSPAPSTRDFFEKANELTKSYSANCN